MSKENCICQIVLPRPRTPHESALECCLCQRGLFPLALDNVMDMMTTLNEKLVNQKNHNDLLLMENEALRKTVASLRAELNLLKSDNDVLGRKLVAEAELRSQLLTENDNINSELQELTEKLFCEANNLVSAEARRRFEAENSKKKAILLLEETRDQLQMEQVQMKELKAMIEKYAAEEDRSNYEDRAPSSPKYLGAVSTYQFIGTLAGEDTDHDHQYHHHKESLSSASSGHPVFDVRLYIEFEQFIQKLRAGNGKLAGQMSSYFMRRCFEEDIEPCLKYTGRFASRRLIEALSENSCCVEKIPPMQMETREPVVCALCDHRRHCTYRFRLKAEDQWRVIDKFCRDRVVAVGDFYTLIRHIRQGFCSSIPTPILYREFCRLRGRICYARNGALQLHPSPRSKEPAGATPTVINHHNQRLRLDPTLLQSPVTPTNTLAKNVNMVLLNNPRDFDDVWSLSSDGMCVSPEEDNIEGDDQQAPQMRPMKIPISISTREVPNNDASHSNPHSNSNSPSNSPRSSSNNLEFSASYFKQKANNLVDKKFLTSFFRGKDQKQLQQQQHQPENEVDMN